MSERNAIQRAFDEFGRAAGFEKKSGSWYGRSDEVIAVCNLQKSNYGPLYYFNQAFWLRQLGDERYPKAHASHIGLRLESLLPSAQQEIKELLDLAQDIPDDERMAQLGEVLHGQLWPLIRRGGSIEGLRSMKADGLLQAAAITGPAQRLLACEPAQVAIPRLDSVHEAEFAVVLAVDVHLLSPGQGGRINPVISGYRPVCVMQRPNGVETLIGLCELDPEHDIFPGDNGKAQLRFHRDVADVVRSLVRAGFEFSLVEGPKVIGTATVRQVR